MRDLALAVWDADGRLLIADREGILLPRRPSASGFVDQDLGGERWRVDYLQSFGGRWLLAAGQKVHERDELVVNLTSSQLLPWLLVLPVLLAAVAADHFPVMLQFGHGVFHGRGAGDAGQQRREAAQVAPKRSA